MVYMQERIALEKHLSLILGHSVCFKSPEVALLNPGQLKRTYYRRAHEYHPDKAQALGLNAEYLTERFQMLNHAYSKVVDAWNAGTFEKLIQTEEPSFKSRTNQQKAERHYAQPARNTQEQTSTDHKQKSYTRTSAHTAHFSHRYKTYHPQTSKTYHRGRIPPLQLRLAQYLYYCGKITRETLIQALSWQYSVRPKLGDLARKALFMSHAEVVHVIRHQIPGELFGAASIRLGFLEPGQLMVLMGQQRLLNLPIGNFFTFNGYLTPDQLSQTLEQLRTHNRSISSFGY